MFSETYARESVTGLSRIWCHVVGLAAFLTTPIYVFAFFNAESLLAFLFGASYAGAAMVFALFIFFACAQTVLGWDFTTSTLFILHRRKAVLSSTIEGSVINILLNLVFIPTYGVGGAIFATGLVMVYMVLRQLYVIQKEVQVGLAFPVIGKCFLFSIAAATATKLIAWFVVENILFNVTVYIFVFIHTSKLKKTKIYTVTLKRMFSTTNHAINFVAVAAAIEKRKHFPITGKAKPT
jgi:O-antigen/teichoic acid export membrane protein